MMPTDRHQQVERLLFVYNVESGALAEFLESVRQAFRIGRCPLRSITHGILGEKDAWKTGKSELGALIEYYHRDNVPQALHEQAGGQLPCIAAQTDTGYVMLISPAALRRCRGDVRDLQRRIRYYLAAHNFTV